MSGRPELIWTQVLEHWQRQGHRALLFTQTQQMLDIIERSVQNAGMTYHRMDGSTAVGVRARLVDDFNDNPAIFVFLLTTKVGGVGINLTGANRCYFSPASSVLSPRDYTKAPAASLTRSTRRKG